MAKEKISITVDRELLQKIDELCKEKGENRSEAFERLCARGLQVEGSLLPDGFVEFIRACGPMPIIRQFLKPFLRAKDDGKRYEVVVRADEGDYREWLQQTRAELKEKRGGQG